MVALALSRASLCGIGPSRHCRHSTPQSTHGGACAYAAASCGGAPGLSSPQGATNARRGADVPPCATHAAQVLQGPLATHTGTAGSSAPAWRTWATHMQAVFLPGHTDKPVAATEAKRSAFSLCIRAVGFPLHGSGARRYRTGGATPCCAVHGDRCHRLWHSGCTPRQARIKPRTPPCVLRTCRVRECVNARCIWRGPAASSHTTPVDRLRYTAVQQ